MTGFKTLSAEIAADEYYAWSVHCNIAMPIMEAAGVSHQVANQTAAHLMQHLFQYDVTNHDQYKYGKSGAQSYAEMRIAADEAEDAEIAATAPSARKHALSRTSPKGGPFFGTCSQCGLTDLPSIAVTWACENPANLTSDEALMFAVNDSSHTPSTSPISTDDLRAARVQALQEAALIAQTFGVPGGHISDTARKVAEAIRFRATTPSPVTNEGAGR